MKFLNQITNTNLGDFNYDTTSAIRWMMQRIGDLKMTYNKPMSQSRLLTAGDQHNRPMLGRMYLYRYAPKTRAKLPYYDTFPLTIPFRIKGNRMYGLNFHYLDLNTRRRLFSNIIDGGYTSGDGLEERAFNFSYKRIKGNRLFAAMPPTIHQYDLRRLRSPLIQIDAKEWPLALYLPVEAFKKESKSTVWKESLSRMI
jgi:hypothetical protein